VKSKEADDSAVFSNEARILSMEGKDHSFK